MASRIAARPTATTLDIEELVRRAWSGEIRVPHFQRDYRWAWEDVRRLFDSVIKGYPIGSLLLWTRPAAAEPIRLGALELDAPETSQAYWVVDGQQRLTSIANALHPDGLEDQRFALAYDLRSEKLVRPPASGNPFVIPLPTLFDLRELLNWFKDNPGIADYVDRANATTRQLRQFEVPAYLVNEDDPAVLRDIFDRMNNYGKRLFRAEVFAALNAGDEETAQDGLTLDRIAEAIDMDMDFGRVDNNTLLAAILARRGTDVRRDIRAEFASGNDEGRDAAYSAGQSALQQAIRFLQNEVGVPHFSLLAYKYLLVVLTRVFALHPELDSRSRTLLRRWYWQAATVGPEHFKGGTPNVARILLKKVQAESLDESLAELLAAVRTPALRVPSIARFNPNEAATKIVLCSWWSLSPADPLTGEPFTRTDLAGAISDRATGTDAVRSIIPRRLVSEELRPSASNRLLMPSDSLDSSDMVQVLTQQSLSMDDDRWDNVLSSHLLTPALLDHLDAGRVTQFLAERTEIIQTHLERFLKLLAQPDFEDTPRLSSLIIDEPSDGR